MMQRGGREDAEESAHWTKEVEGVPLPTLMPPRKTGIMLSPVSIELAFGIPVIMTPGSLQRITRVFWDNIEMGFTEMHAKFRAQMAMSASRTVQDSYSLACDSEPEGVEAP
jgi:hypothetical protein